MEGGGGGGGVGRGFIGIRIYSYKKIKIPSRVFSEHYSGYVP